MENGLEVPGWGLGGEARPGLAAESGPQRLAAVKTDRRTQNGFGLE